MNADTIIIGVGIAGLRCGITLLQKRPSLKIVILEKYKYVGGRVVTYHKKIEDMKGKCSSVQWEMELDAFIEVTERYWVSFINTNFI